MRHTRQRLTVILSSTKNYIFDSIRQNNMSALLIPVTNLGNSLMAILDWRSMTAKLMDLTKCSDHLKYQIYTVHVAQKIDLLGEICWKLNYCIQ